MLNPFPTPWETVIAIITLLLDRFSFFLIHLQVMLLTMGLFSVIFSKLTEIRFTQGVIRPPFCGLMTSKMTWAALLTSLQDSFSCIFPK